MQHSSQSIGPAHQSADVGSTPRCGKGFFSPSQHSVQTLLQCSYSLHGQSHALTSVCMIKIPSLGSHAIVWTNENTGHTSRIGYCCSCGYCSLTHIYIWQSNFLHRINEVLERERERDPFLQQVLLQSFIFSITLATPIKIRSFLLQVVVFMKSPSCLVNPLPQKMMMRQTVAMVTRRNVIVTMAARVTSMTRVKTEALVRPMSVLLLGLYLYKEKYYSMICVSPNPDSNHPLKTVLTLAFLWTLLKAVLRMLSYVSQTS